MLSGRLMANKTAPVMRSFLADLRLRYFCMLIDVQYTGNKKPLVTEGHQYSREWRAVVRTITTEIESDGKLNIANLA